MIEAAIVKRFAAGRESAPFDLDVKFTAPAGVTALFGPAGSGKTLTLEILAGFVRPDAGRILIDDCIVFDASSGVALKPQARRCGYVFDDGALFPHMTLRSNLMFAAAGLPRRERLRRVNDIVERLHLSDVAARKPHEVSAGEKQRASIARALMTDPRALLIDAPARGHDGALPAILAQLEFAMPVVVVTHDLDECLALAGQMHVFDSGRIVQSGPPAQVCARPAKLEVARLLGIYNIIPAEIRALDPVRGTSVLRVGDADITGEYYPGHLKGDRVHLLATPRQLRAHPLDGPPRYNQVPAELVRAFDTAESVRLEFAGGIQVDVPSASSDRNNKKWVIEFPDRGLRVL